ncbi:hypothetical protein KSX_80720 [Ktedonospora formicarum]|uniref:Uncharacterized protein n=1 Tax=Ktedonospora formicarum TaxID=2778364 RepID=A0A8J3ID50_9CHLR|nr:hypothetical protein KSX_80720 [Ktedonospora formicarum]
MRRKDSGLRTLRPLVVAKVAFLMLHLTGEMVHEYRVAVFGVDVRICFSDIEKISFML